jgi:hypothetical protein
MSIMSGLPQQHHPRHGRMLSCCSAARSHRDPYSCSRKSEAKQQFWMKTRNHARSAFMSYLLYSLLCGRDFVLGVELDTAAFTSNSQSGLRRTRQSEPTENSRDERQMLGNGEIEDVLALAANGAVQTAASFDSVSSSRGASFYSEEDSLHKVQTQSSTGDNDFGTRKSAGDAKFDGNEDEDEKLIMDLLYGSREAGGSMPGFPDTPNPTATKETTPAPKATAAPTEPMSPGQPTAAPKTPSPTTVNLPPTASPTSKTTLYPTQKPTTTRVSSAPTNAIPRGCDVSREAALFFIVQQLATPGTELNDTDSPQSKALSWLVGSDPLQLNPCPNSTAVASAARVIQRYGTTVFYFATDGPTSWSNSSGWLSGSSECTWVGWSCKQQSTGNTFPKDDSNATALDDSYKVVSISLRKFRFPATGEETRWRSHDSFCRAFVFSEQYPSGYVAQRNLGLQ